MSIAGFDPSGGAGVLADIKTFEQLNVYGFGVCSALTVQTDSEFLSVEWMSVSQVIDQAIPLIRKFPLQFLKLGLMKDVDSCLEIVRRLKREQPHLHITWDPVLKSSSGFTFYDPLHSGSLESLLSQCSLITPNYLEAGLLTSNGNIELVMGELQSLANVLLKGGHHPTMPGHDFLYLKNGPIKQFMPRESNASGKHGSGCVLSAAIVAYLSQGFDLTEACYKAKKYAYQFLISNNSLLGYHHG